MTNGSRRPIGVASRSENRQGSSFARPEVACRSRLIPGFLSWVHRNPIPDALPSKRDYQGFRDYLAGFSARGASRLVTTARFEGKRGGKNVGRDGELSKRELGVNSVGGAGVGLVLAGGGARGADEAGALSALLPALEQRGERPSILVGTSVGAINVAFLASTHDHGADDAAAALVTRWREVSKGRVVR